MHSVGTLGRAMICIPGETNQEGTRFHWLLRTSFSSFNLMNVCLWNLPFATFRLYLTMGNWKLRKLNFGEEGLTVLIWTDIPASRTSWIPLILGWCLGSCWQQCHQHAIHIHPRGIHEHAEQSSSNSSPLISLLNCSPPAHVPLCHLKGSCGKWEYFLQKCTSAVSHFTNRNAISSLEN